MTASEKIIVYGHPACLMVGPVLGMLDQSQVEYAYINIQQEPTARDRVREINDGYESVPTLVFPDGSTLTEPSSGQLKAKLRESGYAVPWKAQLIGSAPQYIFIALLVFFVLRIIAVL